MKLASALIGAIVLATALAVGFGTGMLKALADEPREEDQ